MKVFLIILDLIKSVCNNDSRYYADIRQTISASDQEMNSALAELSRVSAATFSAYSVYE